MKTQPKKMSNSLSFGPMGPNRPPSPKLDLSESTGDEGQKSNKCTAARAKSIIKTIFAQLFSHLGKAMKSNGLLGSS